MTNTEIDELKKRYPDPVAYATDVLKYDSGTLGRFLSQGVDSQEFYNLSPATENDNISSNTPALKLICMDDVQQEDVGWLWNPYIPFGKITVLQGDPGAGKTYLGSQIAAIVSNGGAFPVGNVSTGNPYNVIFQTAEDGLGDTIKARLSAAGAECRRIFVIDESEKALTLDDARLREAINQTGAKVVFIDPVQAYIGADCDMHRANEIRPLMSQLGRVAEKTGAAIIMIGHMNKSTGGKSIYRGLGSIDIAAAARSVLAVGEVPGEKYRRAIVQIKSSLAPIGQSILFDLDPAFGFLWAGTSDLSADDVLNWTSPKKDREAPARKEAEEFLLDILSSEDKLAVVVKREAENAGISIETLNDAKKQLGVKSQKRDGVWYWVMDSKIANSSHNKIHGKHGKHGKLPYQDSQDSQDSHVIKCVTEWQSCKEGCDENGNKKPTLSGRI